MNIDFIYVTYNSEKWIDKCFKSILECEYDKKKINLIIVDNDSTDQTLGKLRKFEKENTNIFGSFNIISNNKNLGFGVANNIGFSSGKSDVVLFLNVDTELFTNTLSNLTEEIKNSNEDVGVWELRQFPYEHPKFYNILTGDTSWCSGAAFAVRRDVFEKVNGFDSKIFMYAEDVDLSWRIRAIGYKLKYCPKATINHYSYESAGEVKPNQYLNSVVNNLLLRYRFGSLKDIFNGHIMFLKLLLNSGPFIHSRKRLISCFLKSILSIPHFVSWRIDPLNSSNKETVSKFIGWDYEIIREGAFYYNEYPKEYPLVSIIVRTCQRPEVLKEALNSLRFQTYKNIEVVIVEDGLNKSEKIIKREFTDLNIVYFSTGKKVGRSRAGNIAMQMAKGEYYNFLDDDDLYFADHIEVLVKNIINNNLRAVYSLAYETPIIVTNKEPYEYNEILHLMPYKQEFNRVLLFHHNYIPIQAILFEKSLFVEFGGLDESLDALEDWDLWVRYSVNSDFKMINKATSLYRVPFDRALSSERQKTLDDALITVRNKHKEYLVKDISVFEIQNDLDEILKSYHFKISSEVMANFEKRNPFLLRLLKTLHSQTKKRVFNRK